MSKGVKKLIFLYQLILIDININLYENLQY